MPKTLTNETEWDSRPFSLTLAGCLVIAGLPLAAEAVAEKLPPTLADEMISCTKQADGTFHVLYDDGSEGMWSAVYTERGELAQTMWNSHPQDKYKKVDHDLLQVQSEASGNKPKTTAEIMNDPERVPASASLSPLGECEQRPEETAPLREAFHITDEKSANWYLSKLASIEAEKSRIKAQSEKMLADLDSDASGLKFMYEGELQEFVRCELARKGGKKKTLHLLQATCAFRSVPASVKVADTQAALTYAKQNGLPCIVISERIDAEEYKKLAGGTMLPGMDSTEAREAFTVTFGSK